MHTYKHKQIGVPILSVFGTLIIISVLLIIFTRAIPFMVISLFAIPVLLIITAVFSSLTVEVDTEKISLFFSRGFFKERFYLREISNAQIVKNKWYYGWGIRILPNGYLYNVSGFDAVEIGLKNNKKYRIGTDDAKGLLEGIEKAMKSTQK